MRAAISICQKSHKKWSEKKSGLRFQPLSIGNANQIVSLTSYMREAQRVFFDGLWFAADSHGLFAKITNGTRVDVAGRGSEKEC